MEVNVCDLCKKKEASHSFKVKRASRVSEQCWTKYEKIDICEDCAEKLFGIPSYQTKIKYMTGQDSVLDKKPVR